jgi:hypothetical protein
MHVGQHENVKEIDLITDFGMDVRKKLGNWRVGGSARPTAPPAVRQWRSKSPYLFAAQSQQFF